MTNAPDLLCPAADVRDNDAQGESLRLGPVQALTHDEQMAEYVRLVEEARMRT